MKMRTRVLMIAFLVGLLIAIVELAAMTYCHEACKGMCVCEGKPHYEDFCCFYCIYEGIRINCYKPSWPGAADGCQTWAN